ncbi:MAG TPA: orotidine-5'-phosphate decarboxylase, partial [Candidatus Omnitrophica bacterium]|nr:orotidine-5'-phosphate decarboxylase [Candidatus Omnitrophota bacterium]
AVKLGVFMFNVHSLGGSDMMKKAVEGAEEESQKSGISRPRVLGVTVLTSMDERSLKETGIGRHPGEQVLKLAELAKKAGLDGVVASPRETADIRKRSGQDFLIVTPGIRPEDSEKQDQKRTATPKEAAGSGADYIVIGRPVTKAKDPVAAIKNLLL